MVRKADMFSKRTIKQKVTVTSVDTASEALALSLAEKTKIDIPYMCRLTGKSEEEIADDLSGVIFLNPFYSEGSSEPKYIPADDICRVMSVRSLQLQRRRLRAILLLK